MGGGVEGARAETVALELDNAVSIVSSAQECAVSQSWCSQSELLDMKCGGLRGLVATAVVFNRLSYKLA